MPEPKNPNDEKVEERKNYEDACDFEKMQSPEPWPDPPEEKDRKEK